MASELDLVPGATFAYSNFGYMLLGLIVEQVSGMTYQDFVRDFVLTSDDWIPSSEVFRGRTLLADTNFREPLYDGASGCDSVFDPDGDTVSCPYGSWHLEAMVGHGNLVVSAAPLLRFANRFTLGGSSIGQVHGGSASADVGHAGCFDGTSTIVKHLTSDTHLVVLYAQGSICSSAAPDTAERILSEIEDNITVWPTLDVEGFWLDFTSPEGFYGSYDLPFASIDYALGETEPGTKLRVMPGSSGTWSGVIDQKMLIDAPFGDAILGSN